MNYCNVVLFVPHFSSPPFPFPFKLYLFVIIIIIIRTMIRDIHPSIHLSTHNFVIIPTHPQQQLITVCFTTTNDNDWKGPSSFYNPSSNPKEEQAIPVPVRCEPIKLCVANNDNNILRPQFPELLCLLPNEKRNAHSSTHI